MAAVGVHGALPVGDAPDEGEAGVEDGQAQHEEGHREGDDGVELEQALDGHHRQDIPQEGGARVPHEDLGRVHVVGQEAQAPAGQGGHEDGHIGLADHQGDDQQGHGADGGHAAGQAVQAVDEVDGVGDGHDPDHRHGDGQPAQLPVQVRGEHVGVGDGLDHVAGEHRHQGGHDLHHEFEHGGQGVDVVKDAQHHDDHGAQQHAPHLGGQLQKEQHAEQEAQEDGQPAHAGDGVVVHAAAVLGHVHRLHPDGQVFHHRRGHQGHHQGHHQGGGHHADEGEIQISWHWNLLLISFEAGARKGPGLTALKTRPFYRPCAGSFPPRRRPFPPRRGRRSPDSPCRPAGARSPPGWGAAAPPRPPPRRA